MGVFRNSAGGVPRGIVARPALLARLTQARSVTQISGPAGSGKTQLVRSWIEQERLIDQVAWVPLARGKSDGLRFWIAVADALRGTAPGSAAIRRLTAAPDLDCEILVERLLEDLELVRGRAWLIIDDVHELRSTELVRQLELFMMRAPPALQLILITRHDMQLGLHRTRLEGELTELRAADLSFSVDEADALLTAAGLSLSRAAVGALHQRTEGWAAGLRLAAMSLTGHPDPERFASEFSGSERTVAEFLVAEVLERQPEETRRLLLRTSILDRVNGSLGDALTGDSGSEAILHRLEDANAFVVSLGAARTWFRYHRLFSDLLMLELRRTAPEQLPILHEAAAEWFVEHRLPIDAIRHFQAAQAWPQAGRLLFDHWLDIRLNGRGQAAAELLAAFPPDALAQDAELIALRGAVELDSGSLEEAERNFAVVTRLADTVPEPRRERFEARLAMRRLRIARRRADLGGVLEAARALTVEAQGSGLDVDERAVLVNELGTAELWSLRMEAAEEHLRESLTLARQNDRPYMEASALSHLAILLTFRSSETSRDYAARALELAERNGWTDAWVVWPAYLADATVLLWRGRPAEAEACLARALRSVMAGADPAAALLLHHAHGLLELVRGRPAAALEAFRMTVPFAARVVPDHPLVLKSRAFLLHTQLALGEAERVAQTLDELDGDLRERAEFRIVAATLALSRDDPERAAHELAPVLDGSRQMLAPATWAIQAQLLDAMVCDALGDSGGTGRALERALTLAEPTEAILPFLLHPVPSLLKQHSLHRSSHGSLVSEILNFYAGRDRPSSWGEAESLSVELSDSELRVLRYLPTHLSLKEIGDELYVSVNTVKVHVRHLYAKLGVHTRREAIERARAMGLLARSLRGS